MNFKKSRGFFFGKSCSRNFGAPGCHPNTLIDLVNTASASRSTIKTICMISEGYRNNRDVTGPMNFKKIRTFFFGISCSRGFGALGCHPSTLIDLANTALASRSTIKTICMISEGYRNNTDVTGPMNFKKIRTFVFGNSCSRGFGALGCHPSTLIDLANTALASRSTIKTICMISEGYRNNRDVTGPMNFKKNQDIFFGNSCSRGFGALGCHPSSLLDLGKPALANTGTV